MVTPLQIMKFTPTLKRREICCVDKMGRERKIEKSRKEKEVRRGFREKGAAIWELKKRVLRFVVIWERKKKTKKNNFVLWEMKKKKRLERKGSNLGREELKRDLYFGK